MHDTNDTLTYNMLGQSFLLFHSIMLVHISKTIYKKSFAIICNFTCLTIDILIGLLRLTIKYNLLTLEIINVDPHNTILIPQGMKWHQYCLLPQIHNKVYLQEELEPSKNRCKFWQMEVIDK